MDSRDDRVTKPPPPPPPPKPLSARVQVTAVTARPTGPLRLELTQIGGNSSYTNGLTPSTVTPTAVFEFDVGDDAAQALKLGFKFDILFTKVE